MAALKQPIIVPSMLVDNAGTPIDSTGTAGTNKLKVDATVSATTAVNVVTMAAPTFFAVTAASLTVLAANVARTYLALFNDGANVIYIGFGAPAAVGSGIRLAPSGGVVVMDGAGVSRQDVRAIATVAGPTNLSIQEGS
jgi:hypothetical protein